MLGLVRTMRAMLVCHVSQANICRRLQLVRINVRIGVHMAERAELTAGTTRRLLSVGSVAPTSGLLSATPWVAGA